MNPTEAQKEALKGLPRKTYTLLPEKFPAAKPDTLKDELREQIALVMAIGGPNLYRRAYEKIVELERLLELARAGKKHTNCNLCGMKWYVGYYEPVNDHGDCRSCANDQYGDR